MKKKLKRLLAVTLALSMTMSLLNLTALAAEGDGEPANDTPVCACAVKCEEGTADETCPVCAANAADCRGGPAETESVEMTDLTEAEPVEQTDMTDLTEAAPVDSGEETAGEPVPPVAMTPVAPSAPTQQPEAVDYVITADMDTKAVQKVLTDAAGSTEKVALIKAGTYNSGFNVNGITLYVEGEVVVNGGVALDNATLVGYTGDRDADILKTVQNGAEFTVKGAKLENVTVEII